jgi:hypothetical protein
MSLRERPVPLSTTSYCASRTSQPPRVLLCEAIELRRAWGYKCSKFPADLYFPDLGQGTHGTSFRRTRTGPKAGPVSRSVDELGLIEKGGSNARFAFDYRFKG